MKTWIGVSSIVIGLIAGLGCSPGDRDRARDEQDKAQRQLQETKEKLRENLKSADRQTREDLDKARDQLHQALDQSKHDADKAQERLRDREDHRDDPDSHQ